MTTYVTWTLEPRDPLVVADGRPPAAGMGQSTCLDFPWPSSVVGLARTRSGLDAQGRFDATHIEALLRESVLGPFLLELDADGRGKGLALPTPRDLVAFGPSSRPSFHRLVPRQPSAGAQSSLPVGLVPVDFDGEAPVGKPAPLGAFLRWADYERWLVEGRAPLASAFLGALPRERRFHVSIDQSTGTAADGKLFVSEGLRFWGQGERLALGFGASAGLRVAPGAVKLGGEGRVSWLREGGWQLPACPARLAALLQGARFARVVLATPAIFDGGYLPMTKTIFGAPIVAARVGRPAVISGWDHAHARPKPSRRMVPAGSVYWVDVEAVGPMDDWVGRSWLQPVSEQTEQDRRDGFGLSLVGVAS